MAAHVYWRLLFTLMNADNFAALAKWVPFDPSSTQIPTTSGTASASTAYPGQGATSAFDGNVGTFWLSNGSAPQWLQYQFAAAVDIASFQLTNPPSGNDQHGPLDFALQYSDNGSTWTSLYSYRGVGWAAGQTTLTFNATNVAISPFAIAWRLNITSAGGGTAAVAEWKLYDASSTQIPTAAYSASASSSFDGHQAPGLAFDGNPATPWNSNGNASVGSPETLAYYFGTAVAPASFSIQARADTPSRSPQTFALQSSPDGTVWTTAASYTAAAWTTNGQVQTFGLPAISVAPATAAQGAVTTLTVTGTNTHFVSGTTTVSFSGTGITPGTIIVASATSLTVGITVGVTATTGARTMTVTTGSEAPAAAFTVSVGIFQRGNIDYDQIRSTVRQGAGSKFQMFSGTTPVAGDIAIYDASGNVTDGGSAPATGSVTSVGLAAPAEFTVSGSPVTGSGVLTFAKATQAANVVYAGPATGGAVAPTFRALQAADLPAAAVQTANTVYAGPTTGSPAQPTFRTQVAADVPQVIKVNGVLRG